MKISVIVPVYKVEGYVRRCLESVAAQDCGAEVECVVVNDCTPDSSMTIARQTIEALGEGTVKFRMVEHETNRGLSEARNTGIKASSGTHIFLLDSDDYLPANALRLLAAIAEEYPAAEMVVGNTELVPPTPELAHLRMSDGAFGDYCDNPEATAALMLDNIPVMACNKLYRRELFTEKELWFTPGLLHEDEDWRYRAFNRIKAIAFCYATTYFYEIHPESLSQNSHKDRSFLAMLDILCRFIPRIERPADYRRILRQLYAYTRQLYRLERPDEFMKEFRRRISEIAESGCLPPSLIPAYRYAAGEPVGSLWASIAVAPGSFFLIRQLRRMK